MTRQVQQACSKRVAVKFWLSTQHRSTGCWENNK